MLVREVMTTQPITVRRGTSVQEALQAMAAAGVSALPVVTRGGRLCGIVSEADLIRDRVGHDPRLREQPAPDALDRHVVVDEVMTPHVVSVRPETDLADAVELITSTTVKSVPVVDRTDRVIGMLSRGDVVRVLAHADEDLERDVDQALTQAGLSGWWVRAHDGAVDLVGPSGSASVGLARAVAGTVPGVTTVRVTPD